MTRDEAIKIEMKSLQRHMARAADIALIATANIDALIELGLLKVDEPESDDVKATKLAVKALDDFGYPRNVFNIFYNAGLKVVLK